MNPGADFNALVERAMATGGRDRMRPVIEKELLHYDILFALDQAGLLDHLTFQGGTALRLCHGAPRFSENLDFVAGRDFQHEDLDPIKACIEKQIGKRYGLDVSVRGPGQSEEHHRGKEVQVNRWQISVVTAPARPDLPRQRIRIEVVNVPAWTREPRALIHNYDFLPDGYADTLIMTETLEEIMADKLVSLINTQRYIRYRDIWDLRWLAQQGAQPNGELVGRKINDYGVTSYLHKLEAFRPRLAEIIVDKAFLDSMTRFLPAEVLARTFERREFATFLHRETDKLLAETARQLAGTSPENGFPGLF